MGKGGTGDSALHYLWDYEAKRAEGRKDLELRVSIIRRALLYDGRDTRMQGFKRVLLIKERRKDMKYEFNKFDKVFCDGEIWEVERTADNTGTMKLSTLYPKGYGFMWAGEDEVLPLHIAIKERLIDKDEAEEIVMNSNKALSEEIIQPDGNEDANKGGGLPGKDGTGKDDRADGKLRWDLLPLAEIEDIVNVYTVGAEKYEADSWKNIPDGFERYRAALLRHMVAYMKGERFDKDTGAMHLAQVCWNAIALLYYDKHNKGLIGWKNQEKE